jgi:hypothetical protein
MSAPTSIEVTLTEAVRDVLNTGTRPVPASIPIRAMLDVEPVERPFIVAVAGAGESVHPLVRRLTLALRVRYQADDIAAGPATQHLHASAAALIERSYNFIVALNTAGLRILVWTPGEFSSENEDERGRFAELTWTVTLAQAP